MGRGRDGEDLVRPREVAADLPGDPGRQDAGPAALGRLRGSRLLDGQGLVSLLRDRAAKLGFDAVGIAGADSIPEAHGRLDAWLAADHHGTMGWMEQAPERRAVPQALWDEVRSVVMLGVSTAPPSSPLDRLAARDRGVVATYALRRDYHEAIKGRLKEIASLLKARGGGDVKVFVDTAPVMEKALAAASGIGWTGKHSVVVSRDHGGWLLLGAIYTTLSLPADAPEPDRCGSCRRCLDVCPTDAFPAPYRLDARRCIAYLTIEHAGPIPLEFRRAVGNRIFGCDDCLAVCPWNKFAEASRDARMAFREDLAAARLADLAALDDAAFRAMFAGTPIKRTGRDRFVRNVLIAIGNSGDPALFDAVRARLDDASPLVRGAAIWALSQLYPAPHAEVTTAKAVAQLPSELVRLAAERRAGEPDPEVRAEWDRVLGHPMETAA